MKFLQLTWFHFKRIIRQNWMILVLTLVFPLIIISAFMILMNSDSGAMVADGNTAVVNQSAFVEQEVIPELDSTYQDYFMDDRHAAYKLLDQAQVSMVYEIPANFPETDEPIQVYSLKGTNQDKLFEAEFANILSENIRSQAYAEADIDFSPVQVEEPTIEATYTTINSDLVFIVFMVIFFMSYTTGYIGGDLAKLRKEGLLTRSIISNTYSWQILGSVLSAYLIYNVLSSGLIILITCLMFGVPITNVGLIISLIFAFCIFVAGLTMVLFRIFKNEQLIQILGMIVMMVLVFIALMAPSLGNFSFIQYITPFYWLFEALDTGQILPSALIVTLYGLVLFTAGSFKVERLTRV